MAHVSGSEGLQGRIGYLREMLDKLGLPIFDDDIYLRIEDMAELYNRNFALSRMLAGR